MSDLLLARSENAAQYASLENLRDAINKQLDLISRCKDGEIQPNVVINDNLTLLAVLDDFINQHKGRLDKNDAVFNDIYDFMDGLLGWWRFGSEKKNRTFTLASKHGSRLLIQQLDNLFSLSFYQNKPIFERMNHYEREQ